MIIQNPIEKTPEQLAWEVALQEAKDFDGLPEWATYTTQEAVDAIHNAIGSGNTIAILKSQIDALPNSFVGMKNGLKAIVDDMIAERVILERMAKLIIYLRDRTD